MKAITPVSIWQEGEVKTATHLKCFISYDDLENNAQFTYHLLEEVSQEGPFGSSYLPLATGVVNINGEDYTAWDDSNEQAYAYVASKINLTITSV